MLIRTMNKKMLKHYLMRCFGGMPDSWYLSILYAIIHHRKLNLKNPQRFSEKIQYYKIYYKEPMMIPLTDKYEVRQYVIKKIGGGYLNKLYQICDNAKEINFSLLPEKFVIKTTDGGNGDNVFICRDKKSLDRGEVIKRINGWRNKKYASITREFAYGNAKSRIIVEEYLDDSNSIDGSLNDYKFLCFNGKCEYFWVDKDRYTGHKRAWFDSNLNFLSETKNAYDIAHVTLPENIVDMIKLAEILANPFPFARIDFYNINGRIIFGEITFYPGSGFEPFYPDSFDYELGQKFLINF